MMDWHVMMDRHVMMDWHVMMEITAEITAEIAWGARHQRK